MDCGGLQALGSDSESSQEEFLNESLNSNRSKEPNQSADKSKHEFELKKKETENLYESYKKGLKYLATKDYDSANKIFDSILLNPLINIKLEEPDEIDKDLQKLKYISLKNLSLIQNEQSQNFKYALEYLIQAASIDGTDINLWYEIGSLSIKVGRLIVAKVSFEECLKINPYHWPSLDQLIVILFALGNFTYSLKLVTKALKMDKAYINGLIVLKKIEFLGDVELTAQVKTFLQTEYTDCGIDIEEILDQAPEYLYDDLINRINYIKILSNENLNKIKQNLNNESQLFVEIPEEINSWKSLGNFLLTIINDGKFNLLERFRIKILAKNKNEELMDLNSNDSKKNNENSKEENCSQNENGKKRKQKFDFGNIDDGWWKRRSLRKGIEKNEQNDKSIGDILKNFFSDNMLCDIKTIMTPSKKTSFNQKLLCKTIRLLEEDEQEQIEYFISNLKDSDTTLFEMIKSYLNRLALNYDRQWYESLDDIYIQLFNRLNEQIDIIDFLNEERNLEDFCFLSPSIICYLELKFSNYKLEIESQNSNEEDLDKSFEPRNSKMERLVFLIIEFENLCENVLKSDYEKCYERNPDFFKSLLARTYSLSLFASCNFNYLDLSSEYYEQKICEQLENKEETYVIGISKIFQIITKESIRDFLKQSKKNNIFKLNSRIEKFYKEENYELIIESIQDFAETHKLPLDNSKFNPKIFSYFIRSLIKKPDTDEAKCAYFCRKFLKDCIHYLKEELKNLNLNQSLEPVESAENDNLEKFNYLSEISAFICELLDNLNTLEISSQEVFETNFESKNIIARENIWLMNQIISIYFDSCNDLALKLDLKVKPIKAFFIIFDIIEKKNSKLNTAEFLMLVHEYLARNGFCGCNNGEFLTFSIEKLIKLKLECDFCSTNKNLEIEKQESDDETSKSDKTSTKGSDDEKNICICSDSDELLEQMFYCLFGFRKKSAKHLKNHSRITQKFDSNNCWNLYYFYKPSKFPEYDDMSKFSLTLEIYDLMKDILILIVGSDIDEELDKCSKEFIQEAHSFDSLDQILDSFSIKYNKDKESKFKDIYYFLGDYNFKIEKEKDRKNRFIYNYFIKDLFLNKDRVDSWASLALYKSSETLIFYTESGKIIKTESDMVEFMSDVELSIVFFKKALQYRRPSDHTILLEFGLFVYQISSFTSRLLRMNRLVGFFESDKMKKELELKKNDYLKLANEAYEQLFPSIQDENVNKMEEENLVHDSNQPQNEENFEEEWLQNYMLGKIKEKLKSPIMESLKRYKRAYEILDKNITVYLKKITYKSKNCYNLEANEMFYRIYTLTLKRLEVIGSRPNCEQELNELSDFLENLVETRFVKAHNDFDLDEISMFLHENVFSSSKKLNDIQHKDLFLNCVCICVTGLGQILKRFSQHYRSLYRLAYFYTKFLDFKNLDIARNLLLGNSAWNSLPYMPCSGYFQEKTRTNFYYGIWKISSNTNEEQQDFERAGSFSNHLFKATLLLIEVLEKTSDRFNLLEMSKMFYQKLDPEKKYLNDDMMREYIATKSITASYKNVERTALESFRKTFNNMGEFYAYQNDLIPLLLDSFEIYKIASKNSEKVTKFCENHLTKLYIQFNPEALSRNTPITMEEIVKFCLLIERKEKINKVKTKSRHSITLTNQPTSSGSQ